ncbi:hypothetical protein A8B81_11890 [Sulfitobacter pontiacus]|uniref:DUF7507 domain-containing protein n=1 Tax=Sulfitobacter pontiacus TaxID=60137 RepID=UPI0007DA42E8|nr:DUF11 domain-containing protein [Sulfitobacter pontiacus]OAN80921.1 hypothetical protein A8B81_11890 [Sulfitobacter pontiacus]
MFRVFFSLLFAAVLYAAPAYAQSLVINTVGNPTQAGENETRRAIWSNAGTVGGVSVDIVAEMIQATLNHNFVTVGGRPTISSVGQDEVFIRWSLYRTGTHNIGTNTGGVPVTADIFVQFNDVDGPNNERVFVPVCSGAVDFIRIDSTATTGRDFGTVSGRDETFTLIGDTSYNNEPESGLEIRYSNQSSFVMGRTANNGFVVRLDNPSYSAFETFDYECADFVPPVAEPDSDTGEPDQPLTFSILDNDSVATANDNGPNNASLAASEFGRQSVSLVPPAGATGITQDGAGDTVSFTVPGEGEWSQNDTTGELTFTPVAGFAGAVTPVNYSYRNALGQRSTSARVSATFPGIGVVKSSVFNDEVVDDDNGQINETISYTYQVSNLSSLALETVSLTETTFDGAGDAPTPVYQSGDDGDGVLQEGETWIYTATYTLLLADLGDNTIQNQATARATAPDNTPVSDLSDSDNAGDGDGTGTPGRGGDNDDVTTTSFGQAEIIARNDRSVDVNGTDGADDLLNVLDDNGNGIDTLGGAQASLENVILTVETAATPINDGPVPVLDPGTGLVDVPQGTPAGTYTIRYQICETNNANNCDTATVTVPVIAAPIEAFNDSASNVNGFEGANDVLDVLIDNGLGADTLNDAPATLETVTISVEAAATPINGGPVPVLDPQDGTIDVPAGTPVGVYQITYEICENLNPENCATAVASVTVDAAEILAQDDAVQDVDGYAGAADVLNVLNDNGNGPDTLNDAPATLDNVTLRVDTAATPIADGRPVPALDITDGTVDVPAGTPAGTYQITYALCEDINPENCETATITVEVDAPSVEPANDSIADVDGLVGAEGVLDVLADNGNGPDTVNGEAVVIGDVTLSVATPATPINDGPVPVLNPASGLVDVPANTPAGTYEITYQLCENVNATNCETATVSVTVVPAEIEAFDDAATGVDGRAGAPDLLNVLGDNGNGPDTIGGVAADIDDVTIIVSAAASSINGGPVPVLDPATGAVNVPAGTPAGRYQIGYEVCEDLNPTNCATAVVQIDVDPAAITAVDDVAVGVNGVDGADDLLNVLGDNGNGADTLGAEPADIGDVTLSVNTPATAIRGGPVPVLDAATGLVDVPANTPAGTYEITYGICENLNPESCSEASVSVTVDPTPITIVNDTATGINGRDGVTDLLSVYDDNGNGPDTLNNQQIDPVDVTLTVTSAATSINGGPVPLLDPADGTVDVPAGTPAGTYTISYEVCENLNPSNCGVATVTLTVDAADLVAHADQITNIDGLNGAPGALDVLADNGSGPDTLNGEPASLADTILSVVTPATPVNGGPVPVLDTATGLVDVPAGTPAGSYEIRYELCEALNPTNCSETSVNIAVDAAPVIAQDDVAGDIDGLNGVTDLLNVLEDNGNGPDTIGGVDADINALTIAVQSPATPINGGPVPELNLASGTVDVPAGTPAGRYDITYQICEDLNPTNCNTATVTLVVAAAELVAQDDAVSGVDGIAGASDVMNVLADNANGTDTLGGAAATIEDVTLAVNRAATPINGGPVPVLDPADGTIDVAPNTPAGTYEILYQLCENLNPTNCDTATARVTVDAAVLDLQDDQVSDVDGLVGAADVLNVLDDNGNGADTLDGAPVDLADVTLTVASPATSIDGGAVPVLDPTDGTVDVAPSTPAGRYDITYQLCENLNPSNCETATVTIVVDAAEIVAQDDTIVGIGGRAGAANALNILQDNGAGADTIGDAPAGIEDVSVSVQTPATSVNGGPVPTLDPATGALDVPDGTPAGTYEIVYQLCEALNPANCDTARLAVTVDAGALETQPDDYTGTPIDAANGGTLTSVLGDNGNGPDTLNGEPVAPQDVTLRLTDNGRLEGVVINPDGTVDVPAGAPGGTYTVTYQLCEALNPTNCQTAELEVVVAALVAVAEDFAPLDGIAGATTAQSILASDTFDGETVTPEDVILSVDAIDAELTLNEDYTVSINEGTAPGDYALIYTICDAATGTVCSTVTETVTVGTITAEPEDFAELTTDGGTTASILGSDIVNGAAASVDTVTITVDEIAEELTLNADGTLTLAPRNPAGIYEMTYTICQTDAPDICATAIERVVQAPVGDIDIVNEVEVREDNAGPAGTLVYTFTVTNTSNAPVERVALGNLRLFNADGAQLRYATGPSFRRTSSGSPEGRLQPGETATYQATYVPTSRDVASSTVMSQASVTAITTQVEGVQTEPLQLSDVSDDNNDSDGETQEETTDYVFPTSEFPVEGISITKTAALRNVNRGQTVPYTITVTNNNPRFSVTANVVDTLPRDFVFVPGSAQVDGSDVEPQVTNNRVSFADLRIGPQSSMTLNLSGRILESASAGDHVNTADVFDDLSGERLAPSATATVTVAVEPVFDCGDVIGKVFKDDNHNGYQDQGEEGIPAARVAGVDGTIITTDEFGRYHVPCAILPADRGSNFILKLDTRSLPTGYRVTTENPRVMRMTPGKMSEINFGVSMSRIVRVDLNARGFIRDPQTGQTVAHPQLQKGVTEMLRKIAQTPSMIRLTFHLPRDSGVVEQTRARALTRLVEQQIQRDWRRIGDYKMTIEKTYVRKN